MRRSCWGGSIGSVLYEFLKSSAAPRGLPPRVVLLAPG